MVSKVSLSGFTNPLLGLDACCIIVKMHKL